ncbi:hypothetical protein VD0002_g7524 [Verticillium dahliae]|nr:Nitrogen assimilation transcription factor nit-4 [Verticillium dahliae VDG2]KAF3358205.1 Plasma membrane proteolipid 3 [Verticillium dahliae VDG1]KAH6703478.1 hypothetical protein EV126DRAFT_508054 [Verticillium dahliae]PNH29256.1 hypothetical protein BJF96_g7464 [Verticillium dahliae]PNH40359.1 hypothetical protein VD0004_g6630 [Verticillium dahliae]
MPGVVEHIDSLVEAAVAQDAVLFRQPGLKVVAAPWDTTPSDAVAYLHQFIATSNRGRPVKLPTVQDWGQRYKALCPVEILQQINDLYHRTYGTDGILLASRGARR